MFSLSDLLAQFLPVDRVTDMAERVAGRSRMGVWQRAKDRLPALSPIEARGYLRARGISVVREETARLIDQEGQKVAARRADIEDTAMQLLIDMITAQLRRPQAQPTGRRAA